ncbi:ABC transporter substrate-binding protein [Thorsellia kenyensis]|uniref:ABC transporter substrate-binding protein n=1 Tax=Thorsellia kenyensis TaxID=1549888 RepID=A0ABV6CDB4_9GAMM
MFKKSLITLSLLSLFSALSTANAAEVPEGVTLAKEQVLVRSNGSEIQGLDPHRVEGVPERNIFNELLEGLAITDPNGNLIPAGATHWETTDNQNWTFHLRPGVKWSNGDLVTAHDYVYAWQRIITPETASPFASFLEYAHILNSSEIIKGTAKPESLGVKAVDDLTLQVTLSTPVSYFPKMLPHYALSPLHRKTIETHGDKWTSPGNFVGNGAFNLSEWVVNEKIELTRNPLYWDNNKTVLEKVIYVPTDVNVELQRYRADDLDMTLSLSIELFNKMKQELPDELHIGPRLCSYFFDINNNKAPFNDVRVRQALKLALDQKTMAEKVVGQGQLPAYSVVPRAADGITLPTPDWANKSQEERNKEAQALLAEAGFDKKKPLKFQLLYNTNDAHKRIAIAASQMWKKNLGAEVELVNQEWKTFIDSRHNGNYEVSRYGWCADYNDASSFLNIYKSDSSNNTTYYNNPKFDQLLQDAIKSTDEKQRDEIYQQAALQLDEDSPLIPIYDYVNIRMIKPHVGGVTNKEPVDSLYAKDMYIIEKK